MLDLSSQVPLNKIEPFTELLFDKISLQHYHCSSILMESFTKIYLLAWKSSLMGTFQFPNLFLSPSK